MALLKQSNMFFLRVTFFQRDASLLRKFCTILKPEPIVERFISQCYFMSRLGNRLLFFNYGSKRIGWHSFINRAKCISELIPFEWTNLRPLAFKFKIKLISHFFKYFVNCVCLSVMLITLCVIIIYIQVQKERL